MRQGRATTPSLNPLYRDVLAHGYLKAAGIAVGRPGGWKRKPGPKPAMQVTTDSSTEILSFSKPATEVTTDLGSSTVPVDESHRTSSSACEVYRETIELGLSQGRNAMGIFQDLVDSYGFADGYQSVKRRTPARSANRTTAARAPAAEARSSPYLSIRGTVMSEVSICTARKRCHDDAAVAEFSLWLRWPNVSRPLIGQIQLGMSPGRNPRAAFALNPS